MSLLALLTGNNSGTPGSGITRTAPEAYSPAYAGTFFDNYAPGAAVPIHNRALGWYFENEDVIITFTGGAAVTSWLLRDYEGVVVASGNAPTSPLNLGRPGVGWYKLYFVRTPDANNPAWGNSGGELTFIVSRVGAGLLDAPIPVGQEGEGWVSSPNRKYIGSGLVRIRLSIRDADRAAWRASLESVKSQALVALTNLISEPGVNNQRLVIIALGDDECTGGPTPTAEQTYQIKTSVEELAAIGVFHFEGRNEPSTSSRNGTVTAAEYVPFFATVHAADSRAKVLGPCGVNISPGNSGLGWYREFFVAGGGNYIDGISFHPYNATNNDINRGIKTYTDFISLLTEFGQHLKPRYMTEYGHFAWMYGLMDHRWQAQVMMTEVHLLWRYGIHRNHIMYYYDFNVGYWDQPMFMWTSDTGRKCPSALPLLWRTLVEETWGMAFVEALNFGQVENRHWLGSRYRDAAGKECLAIQGSGRFGDIKLSVIGATSLVIADYFGRASTINVINGVATVACTPEPKYVKVPVGVNVDVIPTTYGANVTPYGSTLAVGTTGGTGAHLAVDGNLETFWSATPGDYLPAWITLEFPTTTFDTVEIICPAPWQRSGSLLDFDIQIDQGGGWQTIYTETNTPTSVIWTSHKAVGGTWADSFWDRKRIFLARLSSPVTTSKVRVFVRNMSWGGGATVDQARTLKRVNDYGLPKAIGQAAPPFLTIQDISFYNSTT